MQEFAVLSVRTANYLAGLQHFPTRLQGAFFAFRAEETSVISVLTEELCPATAQALRKVF